MISGARARTSSGTTVRFAAFFSCRSSEKISVPPARSINSETQPIPVINGSGPLLEINFGTLNTVNLDRLQGALHLRHQFLRFLPLADQLAEIADRVVDFLEGCAN